MPQVTVPYTKPKRNTWTLICRLPALAVFFFTSFILLFQTTTTAQPCLIGVGNNSFKVKPAICPGTKAFLQGTKPTGGSNNTYRYQWEESVGNCGNGNFRIIVGATDKDYMVPANAPDNICYRRTVFSGNCVISQSEPMKVDDDDETSPVPPTVNITQTTCTKKGIITITYPAPGGDFKYSINGSPYTNTSGVFADLDPGTYTVTARYINDCTSPARNVTINKPPPATGTISPSTVSICPGKNSVLTVTGGTSYQWYKNNVAINGAKSSTYSATEAGTYSANIVNGTCTGKASNSAVVTVSAVPTGSISPASATICKGGSTTLTVSGGKSYRWYRNGSIISGATGATYTATQTGKYTADIIGTNNCEGKASNESLVTEAKEPTGTISPSTAVLCPGATVTLTVNGGTSYQWYRNGIVINGATTATYAASQSGSYTADIINGECKGKASNAATVSAGTVPTGSITPGKATVCSGGSRVFTVTGGSSYQWYRNNVAIPGATSASYTAEQGGTYTADIIGGTCKGKAANSAVLTIETPPSGSISPATASFCKGGNVLLSVTGGSSYQWYRNGTAIGGATASNYTANQVGTYTADIFNTNGCKGKATNESVVSETTGPTGTISPATVILCTGGSATLTVTGGTSYQWYKDGAALGGATASTLVVNSPGKYTADIISGTCKGKASNTATVTTGATPSGSISPASGTLCGNNGTVSLTVSGGTSYQWYKNGTLINGATASTYTAAEPGKFTADIVNGDCKGKASNEATITAAAAPTGSITPASASYCKGGSVTLTASGGSSYQWYRNGSSISGATSATYVASQSGTYTADIIVNSCTAKASNESVVSEVPEPAGTISPSSVVLCTGGSATLTATGGTSYQWYRNNILISGATSATYGVTQAGTYSADILSGTCKGKATNTATVVSGTSPVGSISPERGLLCGTDASVTLSTGGGSSYQWYKDNKPIVGATAATYSATEAGTYTADIINGDCKGKARNAAVITPGVKPTGSVTPATASLCNGNKQVLTANGGTAYQWKRDGVAIAGATKATFEAVLPGTYSVDITKDGCTGAAGNSAVITESPVITFATESKETLCASSSGSITIKTVTGGSGSGYTYSKDNGTTYQTGNTFTGLPTGTYVVVVKDAAGCKSNAVSVQVKQASTTLNITAKITDIPCNETKGSVTITVTGGIAPFQYSLDGGVPRAENIFDGITAGEHTVVVKDAAGCTAELRFSIKQETSTLTATTTVTNPDCERITGTLTVQATGGTPGYTYSLDGGVFGAVNTFNNITPGSHKVTVKDAKGCTYDSPFDVKQTGATPNLVINNPGRICPGATVSILAVAITAGSDTGLAYSYWTNANATAILANPGTVAAGTYYIKATNRGGCFTIKPVVVALLDVPAGSITVTGSTSACTGEAITLNASAGNAFQWFRNGVALTGATADTLKATASGDYSVSINNGTCTVMAKDTVTLRFQECAALPTTDQSKAVVPTAFTPNRNGENDVLRPILYNIKELRYFKVFNRWGQEIFQTREKGKGWDGNLKGLPQPTETYSWILECIDNDGKLIRQSGRSLLIR